MPDNWLEKAWPVVTLYASNNNPRLRFSSNVHSTSSAVLHVTVRVTLQVCYLLNSTADELNTLWSWCYSSDLNIEMVIYRFISFFVREGGSVWAIFLTQKRFCYVIIVWNPYCNLRVLTIANLCVLICMFSCRGIISFILNNIE